jgi:polysaccharide biosynthesis/export protein
MPRIGTREFGRILWTGLVLSAISAGCSFRQLASSADLGSPEGGPAVPPHELAKVSLPPYVIEAPDILQVDAIRLVPRPPYRIEPLDVLGVRVTETLPDQPIMGVFGVEPEGTINLGFDYGAARVAGMTIEQAKASIERQLRNTLKPGFLVSVVIAETRAQQQVRGPHLVKPDGTVGLGVYGSVYVDNMTIPQAKAAIEAHLSQFVVEPQISLDVAGFNSKVYYVITDGAGLGETVIRLPVTGKTTVLDALGLVNGLPPVTSKHHIWIARPGPAGTCAEQVLAVDWVGITQRGQTATNYQVLPGDRIYLKAAPLITTDTYLARIISPFERVFGVILLGNTTVQSLRNSNNNGTVR